MCYLACMLFPIIILWHFVLTIFFNRVSILISAQSHSLDTIVREKKDKAERKYKVDLIQLFIKLYFHS
jgi:hypothetical protein